MTEHNYREDGTATHVEQLGDVRRLVCVNCGCRALRFEDGEIRRLDEWKKELYCDAAVARRAAAAERRRERLEKNQERLGKVTGHVRKEEMCTTGMDVKLVTAIG